MKRRGGLPPDAAQRGVALMEALISILIFSFGVIGLVGLEARAINFSVDAEDRNRAALLANEIGASMWLASSVTMTAAQSTAWNAIAGDPTNNRGLPNGSVSIGTVAGTTNAADITISWKPPSLAAADPSSTLTTRVTLP